MRAYSAIVFYNEFAYNEYYLYVGNHSGDHTYVHACEVV